MAVSSKDAVIFCEEEPMRRMLTALCAPHPVRTVIADADDDGQRTKAIAHARECDIPLILFTRCPEAYGDIDGVMVYWLSRPFLFEDFHAVLDALNGAAPLSMQTADIASSGNAVPLTLTWDAARRTVRCGDAAVPLTEREADVFAVLYAASPEIVSRETLLAGFDRTAGNGIQVYITYLRRKLAELPLNITIVSRRGQGYALLIPGSPADKHGNITGDYNI